MLIKRITLSNYRLYKGDNSIMFNIDREHNIFLISGENGFGKTTFLYSLLWCLYGRLAIDIEESIRKEVQNGGYSSLLKNNLNYSQKLRVENLSSGIIQSIRRKGYNIENSYIRAFSQYYVEIEFSEVVIPSIPCSSLTVKRGYDIITEKEFVEIKIDGSINELTNEIGPDIFINDFILNKEIARFFFFDSEQIVSLAETNSVAEKKKLCSAYNEVLGVRKYEDLKQNLENVRLRFRKRSDDVNLQSKITRLTEDQSHIQSDIDEIKKSIEKIDKEISDLHTENEQLQIQLLREGNGVTIEELKKLRLVLESTMKKDTEYKQLLKSFFEYAPLAISGKLFLSTFKQVELSHSISQSKSIYKERNNFISDITTDLLQMLHNLDMTQQQRQEIQDKIQTVLSRYRQSSSSMHSLLDITDSDYNEFMSIYGYITSTYQAEFKRLVEDYRKNKQIVERTARRIANIESKEKDSLIRSLRLRKDNIERAIDERTLAVRNLHEKFGVKMQELATTSKKLTELLKNVNLEDIDAKKDRLAATLSSELNNFLVELRQEKKASLEERIKRILNTLMHKDDFIHKVVIDIIDDYMDIELYAPNGTIINKDVLSKGEKQLYATSILKALVEESGIEFPVFIDSPLQKFDKSHAAKIITEFYPSISSQVILFPLLYKELTPEELDLMKPLVNTSYVILNDVNRSYIKQVKTDQLMSVQNVYSN